MSLLRVDNVGKSFRAYDSEWRRFARWFGLPLAPSQEHWVLRHIGFEVRPGEAVGIAGQNGAGKSTLLKLITGTMQPTEGRIEARGRISAILELSMGFSPDLTGRQNARHAASLMGHTDAEIDAAIDWIEAFAEVGEYFDEPTRTYSSGMQMRVAFAVVTAWRPEILIIDEALSVGDAYFKHKSFERIREFREQGTTFLIVSHDRGAIQSLCDRAILLEQGAVVKDGDPESVMDFYNAMIAEKKNELAEVRRNADRGMEARSGSGEARILDVGLYDPDGQPLEFVPVGADVELRIEIEATTSLPELVLGYQIRDRLAQPVFGTNTHNLGGTLTNVHAGSRHGFRFRFPMRIGVGTYSLAVALHAGENHIGSNYDWWNRALIFQVVNLDQNRFVGTAWLPPEWEHETHD